MVIASLINRCPRTFEDFILKSKEDTNSIVANYRKKYIEYAKNRGITYTLVKHIKGYEVRIFENEELIYYRYISGDENKVLDSVIEKIFKYLEEKEND